MKKMGIFLVCFVFLFCGISEALKIGSVFTRAYIGKKGETYNTGITVQGQPHKILVRVLGPSVRSAFGEVVNDPVVKLYDMNLNLLASNDNWVDDSQKSEIEKTNLAPGDNREAALIATLNPGLYSIEVSTADGSTGHVLLEVYDLGESRTLYDEFNTTTLDLQKWEIVSGSPVVDGEYFSCQSSSRDSATGKYTCFVKSSESSFGWGVAVQTKSSVYVPLGIRRCVGMKDGFVVCGEFVIQSSSQIYARVVQLKSETDLTGTVLFSEKIKNLDNGAFLSINFCFDYNSISFFVLSQGSEAVSVINKYIDGLQQKLKTAPLILYSYGVSPINSTFLINYVEY